MRLAFAVVALAVFSAPVVAQEIEPRTYSNAPVGLNFLVAGYGYTEGGVAFDPTVPLTNAQIEVHGAVLAYARTFAVAGRSAKFDVSAPHAWLSGTADVAGVPASREVSGFGDPRLRVSVNLFGAPAKTLQEFRSFQQDLIIGASLVAWAPLGQYDADRLVNIGTNRWALKPELGMSKSFGPWIFELSGGVTFYQDNDEYLGGTREQEPIYSIQSSLVRTFPKGIWASLSGTWYGGGRTTINGVHKNDLQENSRLGVVFSMPVNRHNSIKLMAHTGVSVRTGSDFDAVSIAWQYGWGGGL
ncbi:MAG: hypothetical protein RL030_2101 [Pseudomonadota bacterium]